MPRAPWRRRTTDSPRPAGRRWAGPLRRGGVVARRVLRVRSGPAVPLPTHSSHRSRRSRLTQVDPRTATEIAAIAPVEPALPAPRSVPLLSGAPSRGRRVRFALVNVCTLASLSLGVFAIVLAMRAHVQAAALCLIACVIFDGLDGALARRLGVASPFGAQMDSLADMCSFGVAAPVVVYASLAGSVPPPAAGVACALAAGCAAIRLARFNISPKEGPFFTGVPTTMVAAVLAVAVLIELPLSASAQLLAVALLAFSMVSSFPYVKLGRLAQLPPWLWLAPVAGAVLNAQLTFAAVVAAYLASGPVLWLHQRRTAAP